MNPAFNNLYFKIQDKKNKNILVTTDHGLMIVNRFDYDHKQDGQGIWLLDHGNASTIEAACTFQTISKHNPIIFDIGSNIGTYATWIAKAYPEADVYCFEPQRLVFQILCGNLAINNIDNVKAYNIALGNEDKLLEVNELDYTVPNNYGSFSLIENSIFHTKKTCRIDLIKLDTFVLKYNIPHIDFLKIDCEGMDYDVLLGATETLKKYKPKILIEYKTDWSDDKDKIISFLTKFNYEYMIQEMNILARAKNEIN